MLHQSKKLAAQETLPHPILVLCSLLCPPPVEAFKYLTVRVQYGLLGKFLDQNKQILYLSGTKKPRKLQQQLFQTLPAGNDSPNQQGEVSAHHSSRKK